MKRFVLSLTAALLLAPLAAAHASAPADAGDFAPLSAPWGSVGPPARSNEAILAAGQLEDRLAFDIPVERGGWVVLATEDQSRAKAGAPVTSYEAIGVYVSLEGDVRTATGTFLLTASNGGHHGGGGSYLRWEPAASTSVTAQLRDDHGRDILRISFPSASAGVEPGRLLAVHVLSGTGHLPKTPFAGDAADAHGTFHLYPAHAGERLEQTAAALAAISGEQRPLRAVLEGTGLALAVIMGVVAARVGGMTLPPAPRPAAVRGVPTRPHGGAILAAALMLIPIVSPFAGAAAEDPADFRAPVPNASLGRDPCTEGAPVREYNVSAIDLEIVYNRFGDHDPEGMMYVLDEELPAVLAERRRIDDLSRFPTGTEESLITPLVLRARLGECLVIHFTNRLAPEAPPEPPHPAAPGMENMISVENFEFLPGSITVENGTDVVFTNLDARPRTFSAADGSWTSGPLPHDGTFVRRFDQEGTFAFVCDDATDKPGVVRVVPPSSPLPLPGAPVPACGTPTVLPGSSTPTRPARAASVHVHGLPVDPRADGAGAVGRNPQSAIPPGTTRDYRVSAAFEGIFFMHDHADPTSFGLNAFPELDQRFRGSNTHGLFGAVVVEPAGATWTNPYTGAPLKSGWRADVHVPGEKSFREFVIFYHDPQLMGKDLIEIPEPKADHGLNYRVETLSHRLNKDNDRCPSGSEDGNRGVNPCQDISLVYSSNVHGDPGTPIPRAYLGDRVKFRIVHAGMEEMHVHHLHGHRWAAVENNNKSTVIDSQSLAPGETFTQTIEAGAGGEDKPHGPGDYIFHCHLFPHLYGGMWSFFRVHDRLELDLLPLSSGSEVPPPTDRPGFPAFMLNMTPGHRPWRPPQEAGFDPRTGLAVAAPGAPYAAVCPATAPIRRYGIAAVEVAAMINLHGDHDPASRIYAFAEDAEAIAAGETEPYPVILRARTGECIVISLENRLFNDNLTNQDILGLGKASIHPHLHAFDVLGSDGTAVGWNFDSTIWPSENITYTYYVDSELQTVVWHDHAAGLETAFRGMYGATLIEPHDAEWRNSHTGGPLYTEGRHRQSEVVFDSLRSDDGSFAEAWQADILLPNAPDRREFFASIQDFVPARRADGQYYRPQEGPLIFADFGLSGVNYRNEPLWHRTHMGTENLFNSRVHGDPSTNVWEAYVGDPVVVRTHQVAFEEMHTFVLDGHRWHAGYRDPLSPVTNSVTLGVSEAFNAYLDCGAGGCAHSPGDYLYRAGAMDDLWPGAWGIFRVHGKPVSHLEPLPDRTLAAPRPVCPPGATERWFDVHAIQKEMLYNSYGDHDPNGLAYVLAHELDLVKAGTKRPDPLVLRVAQGDCLKVKLTNDIPPDRVPHAHSDPQPTGGYVMPHIGPTATTGDLLAMRPYAPGDRVGLHAHLLTYDVSKSDGGRVGLNPDTTVGPGETRIYTYHVDVPPGTTAILEDLGDILTNRHHGLFGAVLVQAPGEYAIHPRTGMPGSNLAIADIVGPEPRRSAVLFQQSGVPVFQTTGRPIPIREAHGSFADAQDAARTVQDALDDLVDRGKERAVIHGVEQAWPGFLVKGSLDGRAFAGRVALDNTLYSLDFAGTAGVPDHSRSVTYTGAGGRPVENVSILLERTGDDETVKTDASGRALFMRYLIPETISVVRFLDSNCRIPVRTDFDGGFNLQVRATPSTLGEASRAAALAIRYLQDHSLPPAPAGISAVDVTGAVWRVVAEDALRVYRIEIDPVTERVLDFAFEARATPSGLPAYLPLADVQQAAHNFLQTHFNTTGVPLSTRIDRFGTWRVELDEGGIATSLRVDGQTGRILALVRGPADVPASGSPLGSGSLGMRVRLEGGRDPVGDLVEVWDRSGHAGGTALREGGRFLLPWTIPLDADEPGDAHMALPTLGLAFHLDASKDGRVEIDIGDALSSTPVKPMLAIERALGELVALDPDIGRSWGLTSLDLVGDGAWHVGISVRRGEFHMDVRVDAVTAEVRGARMTTWESAKDRCSDQPHEHFGPHPAPACGSSFTVGDEEDQGIKAFNYRSEPFTNRLQRNGDPALVYSSLAHRDPATPILRAYSHDPVSIHLVGMQEKQRLSAFGLGGHVWPQQPLDPNSVVRQGQGGVGAYRTFELKLVGGAGGPPGLDGDYLYQGANQRFHTEVGEWGILRVYGERSNMVRDLADPVKLEAPSRQPEPPCSLGSTRRIDVMLVIGSDGSLRLEQREPARSVRAGQTSHLHLRLVDDKGREVQGVRLDVSSDVSWALGEAQGAGFCVVTMPPLEAAGSRTGLLLRAETDASEVTMMLGFDVSGDGRDPQAPGDPRSARDVSGASLSLHMIAALVAAAFVTLRRRRRS